MKKVVRYLLAIFVIFTLNFIIPRTMPGDPVTNLLGENYIVSAASLAELRAELGLDKPLIDQYLDYWKGLLRMELGHSYNLHAKVSSVIRERMTWTLMLMGLAIILGAAAGIFLGASSGWRRDTFKNRFSTLFFLSVYSTPPFFLSLLGLYVFSFKLGVFPLKGYYETGAFWDVVWHFTLPVAVMAVYLASRYYLIMRGSIIQEKGKPYVLYAWAKGLYGKEILYRHVFKNASLPIVTLVALDFGFVLSGALFVEIVFSMNGMGTLIYDALMVRDYPVLQGSFLVITVMVVAANFVADMLYPVIDPRVRKRQ